MLIKALKQTSPGRITVCLEDGSEIRSSLNVVTDLRLFSGKELDDEDIRALRSASGRSIARDRALEMISRRLMSKKELHDKLVQKGESEENADYCVSWLSENGFLSDESYAAAVARHYASKGYGAGRVRTELSRRGVPRELWDEALGAMPETAGKLDRLISAKLKDPGDREQVRKLGNSLYRRGYSWEEIRSALARYGAETDEEY